MVYLEMDDFRFNCIGLLQKSRQLGWFPGIGISTQGVPLLRKTGA